MTAPTIGQRLGPYEIVGKLGAGGMGEVYRARDATLGRDVAIKILPPAFALDEDRRSRFEREARVLATLNHPHIGAIYGVEQGGGAHALVLELVEGETLAARLRAGPLAPADALPIARQIAEALSAAHDKGIVHRDLKPANITITPEGTVKVLDFGLAKTVDPVSSPDLTQSPTMTIGGTRDGLILGTAAYMSPEQTRGRAIDKRTDIWAFGCVLYEMLTGRLAFAGETVSDTIAAILGRAPDWDRLPPATPAALRRLLHRCLDKDPRRRLHDIADARLEIDEALAETPSALRAGEGRRGLRLPVIAWTLAGVLAGAGAVALASWLLSSPPPAPVIRFTIPLPPDARLGEALALSPDGRTLVYGADLGSGRRLYRRTLDALDAIPIRGTEEGDLPSFSPDGASLAFIVERSLKTVPLQGGAARTLSERAGGGGAPAWLADGTIVFAAGARPPALLRVPASGGQEQASTTIDTSRGELEHRLPAAVPGDRAVLLTVHYGGRDSQQVHAVSLATGERTPIVQGNGARVLPTGHLVFQRGGTLWAAPFDAGRLALTAPPMAVVENVDIATDWSAMMGVGANGSLAYATGGPEPYPPRALVWVDRAGNETPIDAPPRSWWWPQISPDGRRLGFHIMDPVNMDAWIFELDRGPLVRVTHHAFQDGYPLWTPDGRHVVFWSRQSGGVADLYIRPADLTGSDRRLTANSGGYQLPLSWADNGRVLLYQDFSYDTRSDIGVVPIDGSSAPRLIINGPAEEGRPDVSPDGRWLAYESHVSGRPEVYVQPFPELDGRWQVSTQGGSTPVWSRDGRELFYRNGQAMMSVPVAITGRTFTFGNPRRLFEGNYVPEGRILYDARSYAVAPDGRFLMMKETASAGDRRLVVVANWAGEVARLVPPAR